MDTPTRKPTCATLFSGGGGVELGYVAAGFTPVLAVEYDKDIASVYADNFTTDHLVVADVRDVDYTPWRGKVDLLHASPVCTRASVANANRGESDLDRTCAEATVRAIEEIEPRFVTIENVQQYRKFDSYRLIIAALDRLGYWTEENILNAADYGVPQTRVRLIVRATREGHLPPLPAKTRRIGWYEAVEDLLPTCKESQLADWQLKRLPENFMESFYVSSTEMREPVGNGVSDTPRIFAKAASKPATPVPATIHSLPRAVLVDKQQTVRQFTRREANEPAPTLTTGNSGRRLANMPSAVLVNTNQSGYDGDHIVSRGGDDPAFTVTGHDLGRSKAVLVSGGSAFAGTVPPAQQDEPAMTVKAGRDTLVRAVLVEGACAGQRMQTVLEFDDPAMTVTAGGGGRVHRAVIATSEQAILFTGQNSRRPQAMLVHGTTTMELREGEEPAAPVMSSAHEKAKMPRAVLVEGEHSGRRGNLHRPAGAPSPTLSVNPKQKAVLVEGEYGGRNGPIHRDAGDPANTVTTLARQKALVPDPDGAVLFRPCKYGPEERGKGYQTADEPAATLLTTAPHSKAMLGCRVVAMTTRCLARFQSFPDSYKLPAKNALASKVIGNSVPPEMMRRVGLGFYEQLTKSGTVGSGDSGSTPQNGD